MTYYVIRKCQVEKQASPFSFMIPPPPSPLLLLLTSPPSLFLPPSSILSLRLFSFSLFFSLLSFFSFYHSFSPFFFPTLLKLFHSLSERTGGRAGGERGRRGREGERRVEKGWACGQSRQIERENFVMWDTAREMGKRGGENPWIRCEEEEEGRRCFNNILMTFLASFALDFPHFCGGNDGNFPGSPFISFFSPPLHSTFSSSIHPAYRWHCRQLCFLIFSPLPPTTSLLYFLFSSSSSSSSSPSSIFLVTVSLLIITLLFVSAFVCLFACLFFLVCNQ